MTNIAPKTGIMRKISSIVFDIGGVLIDWNPRYLFRKVFDSEDEMEWFLANVCSYEWNVQQDGGKLFSVATAELQEKYPEYSDKIALYYDRWEEMLDGEIKGTVEIFRRLKSAGMPLYALSNWSHEAFPVAYEKYAFMKEFDGLVVSGFEKLLKPDHAIYRVLMQRYNINPEEAVYIDDNKPNADAAAELGFNTVHFRSPEQLRTELRSLGLEV